MSLFIMNNITNPSQPHMYSNLQAPESISIYSREQLQLLVPHLLFLKHIKSNWYVLFNVQLTFTQLG